NFPKILSESDIYYRYHSETTKIKYGDLLKLLSELSHVEQLQEAKRIRKKDLEPFIKVTTKMTSGDSAAINVQNSSGNVAILKKMVHLSTEGIKFSWEPKQYYGYTLNPGEIIKVEGRVDGGIAYGAPWNLRFIYSDKDDNLYFQDYSKEGDFVRETQPSPYEGDY
ncbi:MAG TPA: hypothetical protein VKB95_15960, partial [Chitinophagaceae bacterium]|nr:hypothetical protein [Chitinophagaceae bacterium]